MIINPIDLTIALRRLVVLASPQWFHPIAVVEAVSGSIAYHVFNDKAVDARHVLIALVWPAPFTLP